MAFPNAEPRPGREDRTSVIDRGHQEQPAAPRRSGDDRGDSLIVMETPTVLGPTLPDLMMELLALTNGAVTLDELVQEALDFFQHTFGCEAVGLRLCDGFDFPYYQTRGFPEAFVIAERSLCDVGPDGLPISHDGITVECMCGNVLCGRIDRRRPCFTQRGTFWVNSTSRFLKEADWLDPRWRIRGRCHGQGYETVVLTPLRHNGDTLGLLQLNDARPGRFSTALVHLLEKLADAFVPALARCQRYEATRRSEEQLRQLGDRLAGAAYLGEVGPLPGHRPRFLYVNDGIERIWGRPCENFDGFHRFWRDSLHAADRERVLAAFDAFLAGAADYDVQYRIVRADGATRWVWSRGFTIRNETGAVHRFGGVVEDITERVLAERALVQAESEKTRILDTTEEMFAYYDPDLRILWANKAAHDSVDARPGELMGRHCYEIWHRRETPCEHCPVLAARATGKTHEAEVETPDGRRWLLRGSPVHDETGNLVGLIEFGRDVSLVRHHEAKLVAQQRQLAQLNTQLACMQEHERRHVAQVLHDEIGQPLICAKMQLDAALADLPRSADSESIRRARDWVARLIEQARTLNFELGSPLLYECGLEPAVQEWLAAEVASTGLQTRFEDDEQDKPLTEDMRVFLYRAARELLANVVRHAQARRVRVALARQGDNCRLEVSDDGRGFEPPAEGFDLHTSHGFGLFAIQTRLAQCGGRCIIDTGPGRGTRVTLWVPLMSADTMDVAAD